GFELNDVGDLSGAGKLNFFRLSGTTFKSRVLRFLQHLQILVQVRRKKEELPMLDLKSPDRFADSAFAKQNDLPTLRVGFANACPLLQTDLELIGKIHA